MWSSIVSIEIPKCRFLLFHKVSVKFCIPQTGYLAKQLNTVHILIDLTL